MSAKIQQIENPRTQDQVPFVSPTSSIVANWKQAEEAALASKVYSMQKEQLTRHLMKHGLISSDSASSKLEKHAISCFNSVKNAY